VKQIKIPSFRDFCLGIKQLLIGNRRKFILIKDQKQIHLFNPKDDNFHIILDTVFYNPYNLNNKFDVLVNK
jgi:hypothetical protein